MPKIAYKEIKFQDKTLKLIQLINSIVEEYHEQGYDLTLRQVYYQLVARGYIPNNERSYKNLGNVLNDGRLAGLIDWNSIVDRTRNLRRNSHWDTPKDIIQSAAYQFALDKWKDQPNYVEVWVEKDALVGVVGQICNNLDVPYFSCRGYVSQSEMWTAARRFISERNRRESCTILHLGDHDPSGIDMTRDIQERLSMFGAEVNVKRIALTMSQVELYNPPPNPTKLTDARAGSYLSTYGEECWELDALDPSVMSELISTHVKELRDYDLYQAQVDKERRQRHDLHNIHDYWRNVTYYARRFENGVFDTVVDEEEDDEDETC